MAGSLVARAGGIGEWFWEAQDDVPVLRYIRHVARAHMISPEALLVCWLARIAAMLPPGTLIDTGIGSPTPLHMFAAILGGSSAGKSSAVGVAQKEIPWPGYMVRFDGPIGSGEGLVENLMGYDEHGKRVQVVGNALVTIDEGQVMSDMARRAGSTILPTLRSIWTGGQIGQANAAKETRRIIEAHTYSYGVILLLQPALAGAFLEDAVGGTPQRFLFASAWDPDAPDTPPRWPWPSYLLPEPVPHLGDPIVFEVDDEIIGWLERDRLSNVRGETAVEPLDGHLNLLQLRVAALLTLLIRWPNSPWSTPYITVMVWDLASEIIEYSCSIRDLVIEDQAAFQAAEDHSLGMRAGRRAVAADTAYVRSVADRIVQIRASRHPKGYAWTPLEIKKRLGRKQREVFEAAMAVLDEPHSP